MLTITPPVAPGNNLYICIKSQLFSGREGVEEGWRIGGREWEGGGGVGMNDGQTLASPPGPQSIAVLTHF